MTYLPRIALTLFISVQAVCVIVCNVHAESGSAPIQSDKSFSQTLKESYHDLKSSVTHALGGYTGNIDEDPQAYMDNYRKDLKEYHESIREARNDYRRSRLAEQKSYLKHHGTLPMNENIDADMIPTSKQQP